MKIITQEMRNVAKNYLKNLFEIELSKISEKLIEFLFDNNEKNKNIFIELSDKIKRTIITILQKCIQYIDGLYKNSVERKMYYNINKSNDFRSISTIFGVLEFTRTYYEDKNRENHFYFIDQMFNFQEYARYDISVKALAISLAFNTNQKKGGELVNTVINPFNDTLNYSIARQTVYNWISKWNVPIIEYNPKETLEELYRMVDEKYIHEQIKSLNTDTVETKTNSEIKSEILNETVDSQENLYKTEKSKKQKHNIMSKAFVCFTGIEELSGNRRFLQNRHIFLTSSKSAWDEFANEISKIYDFEKIKNIYLLSDAGKWITAGFHHVKFFEKNTLIKCLCEFHLKEYVNRSTKDTNIKERIYTAINNSDKNIIKDIYTELKIDKDEKRVEKLCKYENYILNNWQSILNMKDSTYKSSMESHISHYVAGYFSSRPKAFGKKNIQKYLKIKEYESNGINILNLFLETYDNTETSIIKEDGTNFSLFEKILSSNIPILEHGKFNNLYKSLNRLAH